MKRKAGSGRVGERQSTDTDMTAFAGGTYINDRRGMRHIRICAGPQRDRYIHDIIFEAKILGRREAWAAEHPDQPVPETDFYRYLDTSWETVDHHDDDSLNNAPENLVRMRRSENAAKASRARTRKRGDENGNQVKDGNRNRNDNGSGDRNQCPPEPAD